MALAAGQCSIGQPPMPRRGGSGKCGFFGPPSATKSWNKPAPKISPLLLINRLSISLALSKRATRSMARIAFCIFLTGVAFLALGDLKAQQVLLGHDDTPIPAKPIIKKEDAPRPAEPSPAATTTAHKLTDVVAGPTQSSATKVESAKSASAAEITPKPGSSPSRVVKADSSTVRPTGVDKTKSQPTLLMVAHPPTATPAATHPSPAKTQSTPTTTVVSASPKPLKATPGLPAPQTMRLTRVEGPTSEPQSQLPLASAEQTSRFIRAPLETAFVRLADGFDFPVGKPDAQGYYKARGFRSQGHLGEDWDGIRGGDTDLGDPIYCIGDGVVVFARDCHAGWGNVIIVRHSYRDNGMVKNVDSLYGHLEKMLVHRGQLVSRGQQIATMGTAHGLYDAHLHLEVRKNIEIGMSRAKFAQDSSNYYDPTQFINLHRHLQGGGASYRVAMNTFLYDARINWAKVKNFSHSHHRGGTSESATALKKAVAKKN